ncbi:MAG TPA: hypothetical protein VF017_01615 [Thermoanaerobaculia bacterium]|nr:hypothetical protein [Thermoanaerobaculia bacterium]
MEKALVRAASSVTWRLEELIIRRCYIEWLNDHFVGPVRGPSSQRLAFGRLAVRDFHVDLAALMDSVVPVVSAIDDPSRKRQYWPSFNELFTGRGRDLWPPSPDVKAFLQGTRGWWPFTCEIRNCMVHRRYSSLVLDDGGGTFLFQLYLTGDNPLVTEPLLRAEVGTDVADFFLYSAWAMAEAIHFLDAVGQLLFRKFKLEEDVLERAHGGREMKLLGRDLDLLLERVATLQGDSHLLDTGGLSSPKTREAVHVAGE